MTHGDGIIFFPVPMTDLSADAIPYLTIDGAEVFQPVFCWCDIQSGSRDCNCHPFVASVFRPSKYPSHIFW